MACGHSPICAGQVSTSQETTTKFGTKTNYYWQQREKAWISIQTWELWPSNLVTPGQGRERHVRRVKWEHGKKGHCLRALDSLWIKWSFWFLGFSHLIHFYVFNFIKKKNSFILNVIFHQQIKFKKYYRHYCYRRVYLSIQDYFKHSPCVSQNGEAMMKTSKELHAERSFGSESMAFSVLRFMGSLLLTTSRAAEALWWFYPEGSILKSLFSLNLTS